VHVDEQLIPPTTRTCLKDYTFNYARAGGSLGRGADHGGANGAPGGAPAGGVQDRRTCPSTCGPDRYRSSRLLVDRASFIRRQRTVLNAGSILVPCVTN
jgi:hypothetical protein